jgi:type II secretion system protein H
MSRRRRPSAFTLVELLVVMALLTVVLAIAAPTLGRSIRQRSLDGEATRFLAATEYARNEAVSQGVPMIVWLDPEGFSFGVEVKQGFEGDDARNREFELREGVMLDSDEKTKTNGVIVAMEFGSDGAPEETSVEEVRFVWRDEPPVHIAKTKDGWGYEILKGTQ